MTGLDRAKDLIRQRERLMMWIAGGPLFIMCGLAAVSSGLSGVFFMFIGVFIVWSIPACIGVMVYTNRRRKKLQADYPSVEAAWSEAERQVKAEDERDKLKRRDKKAYATLLRYDEDVREAAELLRKPLTTITTAPIVLKASELPYWAEPATLYMLQKQTSYVGGSGGLSVRVARGLWLRGGSYRGERIVTNAIAPVDHGTIVVTDRRIVFLGQGQTVEVALAKVVAFQPFDDGLRVDIANRKPCTFVTGNPRMTAVVARVVEGTQDQTVQEQCQEELTSG